MLETRTWRRVVMVTLLAAACAPKDADQQAVDTLSCADTRSGQVSSIPLEVQALEVAGYLGTEQPWQFEVYEDRAYTGAGPELAVLDLADRTRPTLLGYTVLRGTILDLAPAGSHVYAATGSSGLQVIDVSHPAHPARIATLFQDTIVDGVLIDGDFAYVSDGSLHLLDISDPAAPVEVGTLASPDPANPVGRVAAIVGSHLYTVYNSAFGRAGGFRIIDVSNPTAPVELGSITAGSLARDLEIIGRHAYLLTGQGVPCLTIVDIQDPTRPVPVLVGAQTCWPGLAMATSTGRVLLAAPSPSGLGGSLELVDPANPAAPTRVGDPLQLSSRPTNLVTAEGYVYVSTTDGIVIVDLSDTESPTVAGTFILDTLPLPGKGVALVDCYAYVAAGESGLQVVDLSSPAAPSVVGAIDTPGQAWAVSLVGRYAYVTDEYAGLRVIDISDPTSPTEVGSYDVPGPYEFFHGLSVMGDYAYVADGGLELSGLRIVDISDPAHPAEVGFISLTDPGLYALPPRAEDVVASGAYVYLAAGTAGLRVIDISDPTAPVEVGFYQTPGRADNLALGGEYVYLIDGDLRIVDVSQPTAPSLGGFYDLPDSGIVSHVAIQGDYAFVTGNDTRVLDISDPSTILDVATSPIQSSAIDVSGDIISVLGPGLFVLRATR